jgi:hypothetical protein
MSRTVSYSTPAVLIRVVSLIKEATSSQEVLLPYVLKLRKSEKGLLSDDITNDAE